jgi:hypothetical protein
MELKDLFISKVRIKLLETFFSEPSEIYHVRELVRKTDEEINAVRRELAHMEKSGMVKKEPRANRLYYWFRKDYLFYDEISSLVAKSTGLGHELLKNRAKLGKISFVMFSGKFVKRIPRKDEEIDILIVGNVVMPEIAALIHQEQTKRSEEVNYTVMTDDEFAMRKRRRDPFLEGILQSSRTMIIGEEEDLVQV